MEQRQFEQAVLHLVYAGGLARLTPAAVAYQLGLAVKDSERRLDQMVADGTLELDSDDEGNLFYFVPGAPTGPLDQAVPGAAGAAGWAAQQGPGGWAGSSPGPPGGQPRPQGWAAEHGPHPPGGHPAWGTGAPPAHGGWPPAGGHGGPGSPPWSHGPGGSPGMGGQGYSNAPAAQPGWGHGQAGAMVPYRGGAPPIHRGSSDPPRSPTTAAVLSAFPGAGQLYNGQIGKALAFFFTSMLMYSVFWPAGLATHIWAVVDAHTTSRRTPRGLLPP